MAGVYQHASDSIPGYPPFSGVIRISDGKFIACAADSQEWQDYLDWAALDPVLNVPDPYLSPNAGGIAVVPVQDQPVYGSMVDSIPAADPTLSPPVMVDVPAMGGSAGMVGDVLQCTMGNWNNEPTLYEWRWFNDSPADLSSGDTYVVRDSDVGFNIFCVVTATNLYGSTASPPSNMLMATAAPEVLVETEAVAPPPESVAHATRSHRGTHHAEENPER